MEKQIHELNPDTNTVRIIKKDTTYVRISKIWLSELPAELRSTQRLLLILLKSYKGKQGLICPSLRTLAMNSGLSLKGVFKIIKQLEEMKAIKIAKKTGKYNSYKVLV